MGIDLGETPSWYEDIHWQMKIEDRGKVEIVEKVMASLANIDVQNDDADEDFCWFHGGKYVGLV